MQPARADTVFHCPVFQHRNVKPPAIETDQTREQLAAIRKEPVDQILFLGREVPTRPQFFDFVHFTIVIALDGRTQETDGDNFVKGLPGKAIAAIGDLKMIVFEHLAPGFRVRCGFPG